MLLLLTGLARAQDWPGGAEYQPEPFNADSVRPTLDPGALQLTESAEIPEHFIVRADLIQVHNPLIWEDIDGVPKKIIGDTIGLHLGAGMGLGPVRLGASAPLLRLVNSDVHAVPLMMAGDLALSGKLSLTQRDRLRLAVLSEQTVSLGAVKHQLGHDGPSTALGVAAGIGSERRWLLNLGYRLQ